MNANANAYRPQHSTDEAKPYAIVATDTGKELATYADPRDCREALTTYYGWSVAKARAVDWDAIAEPCCTDTPKPSIVALVMSLADDDNVTEEETAAVIEWCREWYSDCADGFADALEDVRDMDTATLLRGCERLLDGGLRFVLDDIRRTAETAKPCYCESSYCDCGASCNRPASGHVRVDYVGTICNTCAANMCASGGSEYIHLM